MDLDPDREYLGHGAVVILFMVYGDNGDYYCGEELIGVGDSREEAEGIADQAKHTYHTARGSTGILRWHDVPIEEKETGKVWACA